MKMSYAVLIAGAMVAGGLATIVTGPGTGASQVTSPITPVITEMSAQDDGVWVALSSGEIALCTGIEDGREMTVRCVRGAP